MNSREKTLATRRIWLERCLPTYWRVIFNHPPLNIFGPESIPQLGEVVSALETDPDVKVVVFDSGWRASF
jgi:enoyl-CoA hydratase/carnithine racemase